MKRLLTILLFLMLITSLAVPVFAAETTRITISPASVTADPGDEVIFTVTIEGSQTCRYYGLILEYDAAVYEVTGGECTAENAMFDAFDPERGFVVLYEKEQVPSGEIGTFTLRVREDAAAGSAPVSGRASVKTGNVALETEVVDASVTISGSGAAESETVVPTQENPTQPASGQSKPEQPDPEKKQPAQTDAAEPTEQMTMTPAETEPTAAETVADTTGETAAAQTAAVTEAASEQEEMGGSALPLILVALTAVCAIGLAVIFTRRKKQ